MREDRGANPDEHELGERLILIRLPGLVPALVPSRELARVAMTALPVVHGDVARHDRRNGLELLAYFPQRGRLESELGLHVLELRWPRRPQMPDQTRTFVAGSVGFGQRRARERVDRAHR